jgi:predicted transposase YdaD
MSRRARRESARGVPEGVPGHGERLARIAGRSGLDAEEREALRVEAGRDLLQIAQRLDVSRREATLALWKFDTAAWLVLHVVD